MRDDAARLDRHASHAREVEGRLHDDVGLGEPARDVADGALGDARHVVWPVRKDARRSKRERVLDARGGRPCSHVTRTASAPSAARYGSSAMTTATASPAWARDRIGDGRVMVRAHRRGRHQRRHTGRALGQVARGQHGNDAGQPPRRACVDRADARVGVRTAHDGRVQQALDAHVVDIATAAGEEARSSVRRTRAPMVVVTGVWQYKASFSTARRARGGHGWVTSRWWAGARFPTDGTSWRRRP